MHPFLKVTISLLQHLPDKNNAAGSSVATNVILSGGCTGDHSGSGVLNLHLLKQGLAVLGDLHVATATDKHLQSSFGSKIGLEHFLHSLSGIHVHGEGDATARHLTVLVQHLDCGHCWR